MSRPHHHRRHRAHRAGQAAAVDQRLALLHGAGRAAWASSCWRWPSCRCWAWAAAQLFKAETPGPMKDAEAHAAHRRDRARPVGASTSASRWPASSPTAGPAWAGPTPSCTCARPWAWAASRRYDASFGALRTRRRSRPWPSSSCCWRASTSRCTSWPGGSARCAVLWRDVEARAYRALMLAAVLLVVGLPAGATASTPTSARRCATPRSTWCRSPPPPASRPYDYAQWPMFAPLLMLFLCCFATCAGSTGGGIKMVRMLLLLKQAQRELVRIVHPQRGEPGDAGRQAVGAAHQVHESVLAFMLIYGATLVGADDAAAVQRAGRGHAPSPPWSPASTTPAPAWARSARRSTTRA